MELDASRVPFWHLLHCGGNGRNWMLLSGISSIVAVMDGTGCFTCAFLASIPILHIEFICPFHRIIISSGADVILSLVAQYCSKFDHSVWAICTCRMCAHTQQLNAEYMYMHSI